jgi:hypothetical protein
VAGCRPGGLPCAVLDDERGHRRRGRPVLITGRQRMETINTRSFSQYAERMAKRLEEELRTIGVRRF